MWSHLEIGRWSCLVVVDAQVYAQSKQYRQHIQCVQTVQYTLNEVRTVHSVHIANTVLNAMHLLGAIMIRGKGLHFYGFHKASTSPEGQGIHS